MRRKKAGGGWENVKPNDERMSAPRACHTNALVSGRQWPRPPRCHTLAVHPPLCMQGCG